MVRGPILCSPDGAVADIFDGATIMVAGFSIAGIAQRLIKALIARGSRDLTVIANHVHGSFSDRYDASHLVATGLVRQIITSFPAPFRASLIGSAEALYRDGRLNVEIVPQGTLAERIRAGGMGIGGFWVRIGVGTIFEEGKEKRRFADGHEYVLEAPLRADFALLRAKEADVLGNLVYEKTQRNYNPIMAMAADVVIVQVDQVIRGKTLDPDVMVTSGEFVDRLVISSME
jgi:3-oxoadipate CoA-transferase alpha subunit